MIVKCPICHKEISGNEGDIRGHAAAHRMIEHDKWKITLEELDKWNKWIRTLPQLDKSWNE